MARPRKADRIRELESEPLSCSEQIVHVEAVRAVRAALPGARMVAGTSALFAALGDPTRLRIVAALATHSLCVYDLAAALGLSQSAVSHQLRGLRQLGLVKPQREGRRVYYTLDDRHVTMLFGQAIEHVRHQAGELADA